VFALKKKSKKEQKFYGGIKSKHENVLKTLVLHFIKKSKKRAIGNLYSDMCYSIR